MSFDFEHAHRRKEQIKNNIEKSYNGNLTPLTDEELEKAANDFFEKGGKRAVIGEKRMFGGREYIKTAQGWKFHGKGGGKKAKQHQEDSIEHHKKAGTKHPSEGGGDDDGGKKDGLEGAKKSVSDALVSRFTNSEDEGAHENAEKAIKDYMKAAGINPVHIDKEPIMEDEMFYSEDGDMSPKQAQSHVKNKVLPYLDRVIQAMKDDGLGIDERKENEEGQQKATDFLVDFFGEDQINEYKKGGWTKEDRDELIDNIHDALHDDTNDMDEPDYFSDDESGLARPSYDQMKRAAEKIADKILEGKKEKKEKKSKKEDKDIKGRYSLKQAKKDIKENFETYLSEPGGVTSEQLIDTINNYFDAKGVDLRYKNEDSDKVFEEMFPDDDGYEIYSAPKAAKMVRASVLPYLDKKIDEHLNPKDESWKGTNVRDMSAKQLRAAADHFGISTEGMKLKDVRAAVLDKTVDSHLEKLKKTKPAPGVSEAVESGKEDGVPMLRYGKKYNPLDSSEEAKKYFKDTMKLQDETFGDNFNKNKEYQKLVDNWDGKDLQKLKNTVFEHVSKKKKGYDKDVVEHAVNSITAMAAQKKVYRNKGKEWE